MKITRMDIDASCIVDPYENFQPYKSIILLIITVLMTALLREEKQLLKRV